MNSKLPLIWLLGQWAPEAERDLRVSLDGLAAVRLIVPEHHDWREVWAQTPPQERPAVAVWSGLPVPAHDLAGLSCPVVGWEQDVEAEGRLSHDPEQAAERIMALAETGLTLWWMPKLRLCLPLSYMLGQYREFMSWLPMDLELGLDAAVLDRAAADQDIYQRAAALCQGRKVSVHLPFMDLAPLSDDPWIRQTSLQRLDQGLQAAIELKADQLVMHSGFYPQAHLDAGQAGSRLAKALQPLLERLGQADIKLVLENVYEPDPQTLLIIFEQLHKGWEDLLGLCLDVGHAGCFSFQLIDAWWRALEPYLKEIHLHDNDGNSDQHLPPGRGDKWFWLGKQIRARTELPLMVLELRKESDLWQSLRWLERSWGTWPEWQ